MSRNNPEKRIFSIRGRFGFTISVLVVCVVVLNLIQFFSMPDIYAYATQLDLQEAADEIMNLNLDDGQFYRAISEIEGAHNVYIEIYQPHDVLVYTTNDNDWIFNQDSPSSDDTTLKPRIMKVLRHKDNKDGSYFEERQEFFAVAKYLVYGDFTNENVGIILYSSVDVITSTARTASWTIFGIGVVFLLVAVTTLVLYSIAFVKPIETINGITKKMTQMDFNQRCPSFRVRELDELSTSVNALSASLELTLKDLQLKNRQLENDIEKEHQMIELRKQFTANASHELKTPLAIIQGYAEGLKYGITDDSPEEYCDTIIEEVQKMNNLVVRLLEITKYDYRGHLLSCSPLNLYDIFSRYLHSMKMIMEKNGITVQLDVDPDFVGYADKELVENVFGNYISNAVSHCENEKMIAVTCKTIGDNYRVSVFNSGKPIAGEDIDHIWHSFYRADKAHSRAQGRFGLGLSIVASAQDIQGKEYGVINHDNGVEFWFDISRYESNRKK